MAGVKAGPVIAADVDPATKKVAVGGYVCHRRADRLPRQAQGDDAQGAQHRRPPDTGGIALSFFRSESALEFDRPAAFGQHLNIPASTALRFEPGDEREVKLVPYGGKRAVYGFNNLVDGPTSGKAGDAAKPKAVALAAKRGFRSKA